MMRTWKLAMAALSLAALQTHPAVAGGLEAPRLSSLRPGCRLELRQGSYPHPRVWLTCGRFTVLVLGRASLEGQVALHTRAHALEFVRLFTTGDSWYFGPEGVIEVTPGREAVPAFFIVPQKQFAECCSAAEVTVVGESKERPWFEVKRTVVDSRDYGVYRLTETVGPDGRLVTDKTLMNRMGRKLGRFFDPFIM